MVLWVAQAPECAEPRDAANMVPRVAVEGAGRMIVVAGEAVAGSIGEEAHLASPAWLAGNIVAWTVAGSGRATGRLRTARWATAASSGQVAGSKMMRLGHSSVSFRPTRGHWPVVTAGEVKGGSSVA